MLAINHTVFIKYWQCLPYFYTLQLLSKTPLQSHFTCVHCCSIFHTIYTWEILVWLLSKDLTKPYQVLALFCLLHKQTDTQWSCVRCRTHRFVGRRLCKKTNAIFHLVYTTCSHDLVQYTVQYTVFLFSNIMAVNHLLYNPVLRQASGLCLPVCGQALVLFCCILII